jgi:hypothetical protein
MGLFGPDRFTKHHGTYIHGTKNFDTGRGIGDRIKGKANTERKIIQQNLYRKFRGEGRGIMESYRLAKAQAAEMLLPKRILELEHQHWEQIVWLPDWVWKKKKEHENWDFFKGKHYVYKIEDGKYYRKQK